MLRLPHEVHGFGHVLAVRLLVELLQGARAKEITHLPFAEWHGETKTFLQMAAYCVGYHVIYDENRRPIRLQSHRQIIPAEPIIPVSGHEEILKLLIEWYDPEDPDWFALEVNQEGMIEVDAVLQKIVETTKVSQREFIADREQFRRIVGWLVVTTSPGVWMSAWRRRRASK